MDGDQVTELLRDILTELRAIREALESQGEYEEEDEEDYEDDEVVHTQSPRRGFRKFCPAREGEFLFHVSIRAPSGSGRHEHTSLVR